MRSFVSEGTAQATLEESHEDFTIAQVIFSLMSIQYFMQLTLEVVNRYKYQVKPLRLRISSLSEIPISMPYSSSLS